MAAFTGPRGWMVRCRNLDIRREQPSSPTSSGGPGTGTPGAGPEVGEGSHGMQAQGVALSGPTAPRGLHVAMRRQSSEGTGASPGGALGSPAALGMSWRDTEELECLSPSERSLPENNTSCRTPTLIFWKRRHWRQKRDCAVPGHPDGGDRDQRSGRGAWDPAVPAAGSCAPKPVAGLTARRLKARTVPPPQWGAVTHHRAMGSGSA
nr:uncharacterized protein LOC118973827 isoform X2 [Manis javanica]